MLPVRLQGSKAQLRSEIANELLDGAVQLVAAAFAARPHDHIGLAGHNRRDHRGNIFRLVRSVGVDEDDHIAGRFIERQPERFAFALAVIEHDARAMVDRNLPRAIARMTVHHENLVGIRADGVDDFAD